MVASGNPSWIELFFEIIEKAFKGGTFDKIRPMGNNADESKKDRKEKGTSHKQNTNYKK